VTCKHTPVYAGAVNLMHNGDVIGVVDVWVCSVCKELFCEEKRWGSTEVSSKLGFVEAERGSKWAVLICRSGKSVEWSLMTVSAGDRLDHRCPSSEDATLRVNADFEIETNESLKNKHLLYLIERHINRTIEV
jgi:hypothetical protein